MNKPIICYNPVHGAQGLFVGYQERSPRIPHSGVWRLQQSQYIECTCGCLIWRYGVIGNKMNSYPSVRHLGKSHLVGRLLLGLTPDDGLVQRHQCHNPRCVNINHLLSGTIADNNRDKMLAGRCGVPQGENHGGARHTDAEVTAALDRVKSGETQTAVAADLGLTRACVSNWCRGKTRKS